MAGVSSLPLSGQSGGYLAEGIFHQRPGLRHAQLGLHILDAPAVGGGIDQEVAPARGVNRPAQQVRHFAGAIVQQPQRIDLARRDDFQHILHLRQGRGRATAAQQRRGLFAPRRRRGSGQARRLLRRQHAAQRRPAGD